MRKTVWYVPCVITSVKMKLWLSGTIVKSPAKWINLFVEIHNYIDMAMVNILSNILKIAGNNNRCVNQ